METINDYSTFRTHCSEFQQEFSEKFLSEGALFCHPLINGLMLAPASDEEAKSNDLTICRVYDVMLMSEDGETGWKPFDIKKAREIAAANEHIYLSDLLFNTVYLAHDWMIDGKHDAIIVSEQYMKDHNKPYAPVTPLTNQKLKIKKIRNEAFWKKGTLEAPQSLLLEDFTRSLDDFSAEKLEEFPVISSVSGTALKLGEEKAEISQEDSREAAIDFALNVIRELKDKMDTVSPMLSALGMRMTASGYSIKFLVSALNKNGVSIDGKDFRMKYYNDLLEKLPDDHSADDELKTAGEAFKKAYIENNSCGFKGAAADEKKYYEKLGDIETSDLTKDSLLVKALGLISEKPADGAVFRLLHANFGDLSEDINAAEKFWFGKSVRYTDADLDGHLKKEYGISDIINDKGEYTCGLEKAKAIYGQLSKAAEKYRFASCTCAASLKAYIDEEDKKSRTFNGTVFETAEEMKKAVRNEKEVADLCADLTALNKEELSKLRKLVYDTTLDSKTKGKYLVKVKLAENSVKENELKQLTLSLPDLKLDDALSMLEKVKAFDCDDAVKKPFVSAAEDRVFAAQAEELSEKFKGLDGKSAEEITALKKAADSDRYCNMLKKIYIRKAETAVNEIAYKDLEKLCGNMETLDKEKLDALKKAVEDKGYPASAASPFLRKISRLRAEYDRKYVAKLFSGISSKSKEELSKLREIINAGTYPAELTDPYISRIAERETAIKYEEFEEKCKTISLMDKASLEEFKKIMHSGEYPESIVGKYTASVTARENFIQKAEIAELCKDIEKNGRDALKALSEKLSDTKYNSEFTAPFFEKIKERNLQLDNAEVDELCKDIDKMDRAAVKALSEKISDEKYNKEYTAKYFEKIKERNLQLDNAEVDELCKDIDKKDRAALKALSEKISDEKYSKEYTAKYFEKIAARNTEIDKAELTELTKDIGNMKKPELVKITERITLNYPRETAAPFIEKIRSKEIELMKKELENLCRNIPSTPRAELSKLKEALKSGDFDSELSAKYIAQIEDREKALIKTELKDICGNIDSTGKEKLLEIKLKISDTPEYAEEGKAYIERIDTRLKKLDKEEFDRMMNSIDKMTAEELDKFVDELEKRRSTMDPARYDETVKLTDARYDKLEKEELNSICGDIPSLGIEQIASALNKIEDGGFNEVNAAPYIKKLNDAANQQYIKELQNITANIGNLDKPQLLEVLKKIDGYGYGCPDDLKKRYRGIVNKKIRESEDKKVAEICRNLNSMTTNEVMNVISKIREMDMDEEAKKRHISNCENHILSKKKELRDSFAQRLDTVMAENSINQSHIITPTSPTFDSLSVKVQNSYAKIGQFDLLMAIHTVNQGNPDEGFAMSLESIYSRTKQGNVFKIAVNDALKFIGKKGLLGGNSLRLEQKNGVNIDLPNNLKGNIEKAANVLNALLNMIQDSKAEERRKDMELMAARNDSFNNIAPAHMEKHTPEAPKPDAAAKPAVSETVEVPKVPKPVEAVKPVEIPRTAEAPAAVEVPKAAPKPVEVPKAAETVKNDGIAVDIKPIKHIETTVKPKENAPVKEIVPIKPITDIVPEIAAVPNEKPAQKPAAEVPDKVEAPKPAPAPASAKPIKMKFCDQCGAKITSDSAKFCSECGNRIMK